MKKKILLIVLCLGFAMTQYNYQVSPYNQSYTEVSYDGDIKILDFYQWNGKKMVMKQTLRLFEDGSIVATVSYNADGDGKAVRYYKNGQIEFERNYKDGKYKGKLKEQWDAYKDKKDISYIWVAKDGTVSIDNQLVKVEDISDIMSLKLANNPRLTVSLKADESTTMEYITMIHEELREAQALKIIYDTKTKEDK